MESCSNEFIMSQVKYYLENRGIGGTQASCSLINELYSRYRAEAERRGLMEPFKGYPIEF